MAKKRKTRAVTDTAKRIAYLTQEEDAFWERTFIAYVNEEGYDDDTADQLTWKHMQEAFPRLRDFDGCSPETGMSNTQVN